MFNVLQLFYDRGPYQIETLIQSGTLIFSKKKSTPKPLSLLIQLTLYGHYKLFEGL